MERLEITVDLGDKLTPTTRPASVMVGGIRVFSEVVYDNPDPGQSASDNILKLFASRLRDVLELGEYTGL